MTSESELIPESESGETGKGALTAAEAAAGGQGRGRGPGILSKLKGKIYYKG